MVGKTFKGMTDAILERQTAELLAAGERPLLLGGDHSVTYPAMKAMAAAAEASGNADFEIVTLADSGHWWMLDDPAGVAAAITDFWAGPR